MAGYNEVYVWNSETSAWEKIGMLSGAKGDQGDSATITVGTVTEGNTVNVENVGTSSEAILNFTLKKGDKGDQGNAATVSVGTVQSGDYPSVTNSGSSTNAVLNFVIPKGDKGDKGNPATVNGKSGVNITLYSTDIMTEEESETSVKSKLDTIETNVSNKADKTALDKWSSNAQASESNEVVFDNLDSSKGYDLFAETNDGSLVTIKSCVQSDGTQANTIKLTYTIKALAEEQEPASFKLRILN